VKKQRLVFTVVSFHVPELLGAYVRKPAQAQRRPAKKHFASQYSTVQSSRRRQVRLVVVRVVGVERNSGPRAHVTKARWRAGWLRSLSALRAVGLGWTGRTIRERKGSERRSGGGSMLCRRGGGRAVMARDDTSARTLNRSPTTTGMLLDRGGRIEGGSKVYGS
jgi:hypothetical protein